MKITKLFYVSPVSENVRSFINERISAYLEDHKADFNNLLAKAKDFIKENPCMGGGDSLFICVNIEDWAFTVEFSVSFYGDGDDIDKFNDKRILKIKPKEEITFLPVPPWVQSSCDCGYASSSGQFEFVSDAKIQIDQFVKLLSGKKK